MTEAGGWGGREGGRGGGGGGGGESGWFSYPSDVFRRASDACPEETRRGKKKGFPWDRGEGKNGGGEGKGERREDCWYCRFSTNKILWFNATQYLMRKPRKHAVALARGLQHVAVREKGGGGGEKGAAG